MAEEAVTFAVEKLDQLLTDEIKFLNGVREGICWMQSELRIIRGFLEDAGARAMNGDNRTKAWITDVTDIAQEAEDVVDAFMSKIEAKNRRRRLRRIAGFPSKIIRLHYVGTEILQIKSKISEISRRRETYGIINIDESSSSTDEILWAQRNLNPRLPENNFLVGFGGHENMILERLIDLEVKNCVVVPIVGMGGLGKTTLATMIYNRDVVKDWFRYRAWVTVSEEFDPRLLLHNLLRQVKGVSGKNNIMDITELKVQVHDCLKKERYFIVMDDIWNLDVWKLLKNAFPDVGNGSRVLITSRDMSVGKYADPSNEPYVLPFLSDKESWQLFLRVVFSSKDDSEPECPEELKTIGEDLVRKCDGLPLAVKMLGGLISVTDPTINAWNTVATKWNLKHQHSDFGILALSYHHLPSINLKSCFLYIGNYPEDHIIRASELTKFWIAEGFIVEEHNQSYEDTAKEYLDEFVLRCMVQVVDRTRTSKRIKFLRIHDLFRKWCISEAQKDGFFQICPSNSDTSATNTTAARRLTVYNSTSDGKFYDSQHKARAILGFNYLSEGNFLLSKIGENFKRLRVLYLEFPGNVNIHRSKILKDISNLIHLRNITLMSRALTYLPSSIGKLHNLQTLNIRSTRILTLPAELYKIENLRHLYTGGVTVQTSTDWNLTNLRTLDYINAGSWMLKDFTKLSSLRKLAISKITQNEVICLRDSLHKLINLKSLRLETEYGASASSLFTSFRNDNPLSKLALINWIDVGTEFPQNLISIRLSHCTCEKGVIASLEKLPGLTNLILEDCRVHPEEELVCSSNGFQQLESLHIAEIHSLLNWRIEEGALPKTKCLIYKALGWFAMLPVGIEHLKSLQKLDLNVNENLKRRLLWTLEDLHKMLPQTNSVTLNGAPLDQYKRSSCIMHHNQINDNNGDDERVVISQLVGGKIKMGRTKVSFDGSVMMAQPGETEMEVMLEVTGLDPAWDAHGVDFVAVLHVGRSNLKTLKSAMKFFAGRLRHIDRLSIVISSSEPAKLCPLRQITERSLVDIENLVNDLALGCDRNMTAGIKMGLDVINSRRFTTGRLAAIVFMSDDNPSEYDHSTAMVQLGNIPVYTFGLANCFDPMAKNVISNAGGSFSYIHDPNDFGVAFLECFDALFGVAVQDLKLTLRPYKYSRIESIFVGDYEQLTDSTSGSITIFFGDLYLREVRRVIVNISLLLPADHDSVEFLQLISSDADGVHIGNPISILQCSTLPG